MKRPAALSKPSAASERYDAVVAGGGLPGLAVALGIGTALGADFRVAVCDPGFARPPAARRAYAVAAGARRFLDSIGIWEAVAGDAQPINDMVITDSRTEDPVRPVFLTFGGEVEPGEPFAHMLEEHVLIEAARTAATKLGIELVAHPVETIEPRATRATVILNGGQTLESALLVAADGARSPCREQAGITMVGWSYGQTAIVATVAHERDHEGKAYEHFLPAGPFATLPLAGRRSSIVWTERDRDATFLLSLDREDVARELERRFGLLLGPVEPVSRLHGFPLRLAIARRFVDSRLALVGDAAHTIHPIAGQGLNLGLKDAAALVEAVVDAARLGLDIGSDEVLETYQRARRFDTAGMGLATDALNRLFSNDFLPARLARDLGLGLVDRMPFAKDFFIREAAGIRGLVPRVMRGEPL